MPKISVVMPVYNGERFLEEAIQSILDQTFTDFEFIIVDDGSQDSTPDILERFQQLDPRIIIRRQSVNAGITACLNLGCSLARGDYIARMDADDISLPTRFEKQVEFLDRNPHIALVGTQTLRIDAEGSPIGQTLLPTQPNVIAWMLFLTNPIVHPSIMMRRFAVKMLGFYQSPDLAVEDYDLWARLILQSKLANLPDVLLKYREWGGSITGQKRLAQARGTVEVMRFLASHYLDEAVPFETADALRAVVWNEPLGSLAQIHAAAVLLERLCRAYGQTVPLSLDEARAVAQDVAERLYALARRALPLSPVYALRLIRQGIRLSPLSVKVAFAYYGRRVMRR